MATARPAYQLSPEQLAIQAERKRKKEEAKLKPKPVVELAQEALIPSRQWIDIPGREGLAKERVLRFQSWNMLAQALVRRELFPTSGDCLKQSNRDAMTIAELLAQSADILCLQEVDRLDKVLPALHGAGYAHTYAAGPFKKHGCMIVHRDSRFDKIGERKVVYDEVSFGEKTDGSPRVGIGRVTKNIGLVVALRDKTDSTKGCIVATTHLFWHPRFVYERVRQTALLLREVRELRQQVAQPSWPCFVIGDFNFAPTDPAYAMIVGAPWSPFHEAEVSNTRVIHVTIDPTIKSSAAPADDDEGGGGEAESQKESDPDRVIINCRTPRETDGLLTLDELLELRPRTHLRSVYDEALRGIAAAGQKLPIPIFSERPNGPLTTELGAYEPMYTSYTHFWKATLDYMFVLDGETTGDGERSPLQPQVVRVISTLATEVMEPGLPKKGVCASDHISIAADVVF